VWGSELTSKAATPQGYPAETAPTPNVKLCVLEVVVVVVASYGFLAQSSF
jgi:hypothetical protein